MIRSRALIICCYLSVYRADKRSGFESAEGWGTCPERTLLYLLPRVTPEFGEIKLPFSSGWNIILDLIQECNFHYLCLMPVSSSTSLGLSDEEGDEQSREIWRKWTEHELWNWLTTQIMGVLVSLVTVDLSHSSSRRDIYTAAVIKV